MNLITVIQLHKGWLQKGWRLSLYKESHVEDKLHQERFHLSIGKTHFTVKSLEQPPHRHDRVPITAGFEGVTEQGARKSHLGSCPMTGWLR